MLENTARALTSDNASMNGNRLLYETAVPVNDMGTSSSTHGTGGIDTFDPILISLIRRTMPNLIAYDICGVQPMNGPTGLIFAMRTRYANQTGPENFYNEVNTMYSTVANGSAVPGGE
jgi:hypothetical protein